jgi:hypothetical protein
MSFLVGIGASQIASYVAGSALMHGPKWFSKIKHSKFKELAGSFGWGVSYAGGTNVGYNVFNEYLTPFMRKSTYAHRPQYLRRL